MFPDSKHKKREDTRKYNRALRRMLGGKENRKEE